MRIGIIGAGSAARDIHLPGFRLCADVEIAAVCDQNLDQARSLEIPDACADYRDLLARPDVEAVVVATPNFLHREIVLAALAAGKHVLCEKPLALNRGEAEEMLHAAERSRKVHMTAFTYRFTPAIQFARSLVSQGSLGELRTVRAAYQMALSGHLLGWRSQIQQAGSGVLADIGSHLVDLVQYLAGDIRALTASKRRFRDDPKSDVEDWIAFLAEFQNGACGTFEISRAAPGRGAGISEEMTIELYGTAGSIVFRLQDPCGLMAVLGAEASAPATPLRRFDVPAEFLKLPGSPRDVAAHDPRWGYRYDQAFQFVESVQLGQARSPNFADGLRCQAVLDAALESARTRNWIDIPG
ncbi:MAG TPA: Gfo/Idh/MocA family oxidoreductase [Bryobacteraceae bacterium]|nr:Gfo/Idh/MocA family oxidoreductase [Bryobacteraceae bacterium]